MLGGVYQPGKVKENCNLFTHGAPGVHKNSFRNVRTFQDRIGIWKCWFLRSGENRSTRRKTSRSKEENQQQPQPTYDAGSGNRTRDTSGGRRALSPLRHPAPHVRAHMYYTQRTRKRKMLIRSNEPALRLPLYPSLSVAFVGNKLIEFKLFRA